MNPVMQHLSLHILLSTSVAIYMYAIFQKIFTIFLFSINLLYHFSQEDSFLKKGEVSRWEMNFQLAVSQSVYSCLIIMLQSVYTQKMLVTR